MLLHKYFPINAKFASCIALLLIIYLNQCGCESNNYLYPIQRGRIKSYTFTLTEGIVQPDNYKQNGYLINGKFPGPPIFVNQNDLLLVTVKNKMTVPVTIHFHGLLQEHTVEADGVPYVTQDPIWPNETYVHEIQIGTQTGTFAYHGHMDFDIVFIHGALIIRDNPSYWNALGVQYHYDRGYEHSFCLEATYHYPLTQFLLDVTGVWKGKPPVMSLPLNGHSYGEWPDHNGNAPGYEVLTVVPRKTYRLRVINMASESFLRFRIEGHRFKIIEMDGILTLPVSTDHLEINTGQRYSILVTMDKAVGNYWIHSENIGGKGPDNGRAILSYIGATDPASWRKKIFKEPTAMVPATTWVLPQLMPNRLLAQTEVYELPKKSNRRIVIDTHMRLLPDGRYRYFVNGHQFNHPETNYLAQVRQGIDISKDNPHVFEVIEGEVVDIVFQNRVMDDGPCLQHPVHLHGHSFYVVAEGPDTLDLQRLDTIIAQNLKDGHLQFRDVFTTFPYQLMSNETSGAGCGWTVIRFIANNPGVWLGHCHITTHMLIGKMFILYEYHPENPRLINE